MYSRVEDIMEIKPIFKATLQFIHLADTFIQGDLEIVTNRCTNVTNCNELYAISKSSS